MFCVALHVGNSASYGVIELNKTNFTVLSAKPWSEVCPYVCQYHCK